MFTKNFNKKSKQLNLLNAFCVIGLTLLSIFASDIKAQTCATEPNGLINWYRAEGNANDTRGGENGTLGFFAGYGSGKVGLQAFNFNANGSDFMSAPASQSYTTITFDAWIFMRSNNPNGFPTIFDRSISPNNGSNRLALYVTSDYRLAAVTGVSSVAFSAPNTIQLNQWTHVALVRSLDGSGNYVITIYVNSSQVSSFTGPSAPLPNFGTLHVGNSIFETNGFDGLIDEAQVFSRDLTQAEIQAIYNAGNAGICFAPTAANVSISGRVFDANGRYVSRATVSLMDSNGATRTARTNTFGFYSFDAIAAGASYVASVSAKGYQFAPQVISVSDSIADLNFTAE